MPTVIIPPTDVSPYTGTGNQVLATNPTFPGIITVNGVGGVNTLKGIVVAGTDIAATDTAAFQVHNNVDDKPMIGFYRGGTLRSVLRLNTDNDFRLLSSDLSTPANLTAGNLTASGGSVLLNALTGNPPQFRHHAVGTADIIAGVNGIRLLNNAASAAGMSLDANNDTTFSGNLTVNGTGTSTFGGTIRAGAGSGETLGAGSVDVAADLGIKSTQGIVQGGARIVAFTNGNTLLGTGTDSGNGKLQLATHTTSAGGIGFGTDVSLFRAASGNLGLYGTGTSSKITFSHSTTTAGKGFEVECDSAKDGYVWNRENRNIFFGTNNTLALTLDSSQNATFAGNALVKSFVTLAGPTSGTSFLHWKETSVADRGVLGFEAGSSTLKYRAGGYSMATGTEVFSISSTGAIAIGNTVQTAVGVASTHKVTISIGGSTYYLLATNV